MDIKGAIIKRVPKAVWRFAAKCEKNEPTILIVTAGIATVAAVAACVPSTIKAIDIVGETKDEIDKVHKAEEMAVEKEDVVYTDQDKTHDLIIIYTKTAGRLLKTYAPSIALTILSLYCMGKSHKIMSARNLALTASVSALKKSYDELYGRIEEKYGKEKAEELKYGLVNETVEKEETDENGKTKKVKEKIKVKSNGYSEYAQFFGVGSKLFRDNPIQDRDFLEIVESILNDQLHRKGYVMLNDAYDQLGLPQKKKYVGKGWCLANPNCEGYIDLGFHDMSRVRTRAFLSGSESGVWLDPNVDTESVYDHLGEAW